MLILTIAALVLQAMTCPSRSRPAQPTETVEGVVVDERGQPMANMTVYGHAGTSTIIGPARTRDDGTFSLPTSPGMVMSLLIGWEECDRSTSTPALVSSGACGVRIALHHTQQKTFRVIDGRTGEPIEHFGLAIAEILDPRTMYELDFEARMHPNGECVAHAVPHSHKVWVHSPGYAPVDIAVRTDSEEGPGSSTQTISLWPGGVLRGRIVHDALGVARVPILLVGGGQGRLMQDAYQPEVDPESWFHGNYALDLYGFLGRERRTMSDADGAFHFDDLETGTYDLIVSPPDLGPKLVRHLRVEGTSDFDMGQVTVERACNLRGRVLLPPSIPASGVRYVVDIAELDPLPLSSDGTFVVSGLGAGVHRVALNVPLAVTSRREERDVRIAPGETKEIVFDLTEKGPVQIAARVIEAGKLRYVTNVEARFEFQPGLFDHRWLFQEKEAGTYRGTFANWKPVSISAFGSNHLRLAHTEAQRSHHGGVLTFEVTVDPGSLALQLPTDLPVPDRGWIVVGLLGSDGEEQSLRAISEVSRVSAGLRLWKSSHCELGELEPGEYAVTVDAFDTGIDTTKTPAQEYAIRLRPTYERKVRVSARETTLIDLSR